MIKEVLKTSEKELNYIVTTPSGESKNLPLVVFLHGAGERGSDLNNIKRHGLPKRLQYYEKMPAITLSPQCEEGKVWPTEIYRIKELIDKIVKEYEVDTSKIYLTGMSMGGFGTWAIACAFPDFFRAIAPVCGGGLAWNVGVIKHLPIHAFHGDIDDVVDPFYSINMVDKLRSLGSNAKLTILKNVGHNCWDWVYEEYKIIEKMIYEDEV
ncbi:MAG: prolyl oligopeptidase family serine peptidase [Clostridia bacterium]|nr:prolyl oligopeptidase family serine peptidase [Clostridia bacterium]